LIAIASAHFEPPLTLSAGLSLSNPSSCSFNPAKSVIPGAYRRPIGFSTSTPLETSPAPNLSSAKSIIK
jgi:hypothetical protein